MCGSADRHGKLPVVELDSRSFETQHGNTIYVPVFRLVDWKIWDGQPTPTAKPVLVPIAPPALPAKPTAQKVAKAPPPKRNDMDDVIPF
jgi:hypothetical protein